MKFYKFDSFGSSIVISSFLSMFMYPDLLAIIFIPFNTFSIFEDKTLISFRAKKREMSDEQKIAAGERMRKYQASKHN